MKLALPLSLVALSLSPASAAPTATWVVDSFEDLEKGKATSAFISSNGEVRPGWAASSIEVEFGGAWSLLRRANGDLIVGTADHGAIYRVRGDKSSKWVTLKDVVAVVSLAEGRNGTIYAGTMPGGEVWKVSSTGDAKRLAKLPKVETVWALAYDKKGRNLYAGTGPDGKLFRIDPISGKATLAFDTGDKRVQALMAAGDGSIWFGTSDEAIVYRHVPKSKRTRAMGDFAGNEITAIAEWNGGAVVAASELKAPSTSGTKTKAAIKQSKKEKNAGEPITKSKGPGTKAPQASATPRRKGARKGKGALFRVRGDGQLTQLHSLTATYFTSIAVTRDGRIYAGAGDQGRIYMIDNDDSVSTVIDVDERVVSHVAASDGQLSFATSDATAVYRTQAEPKKPRYVSQAFDAKATARFGKLVWRSRGSVQMETRSGNTAEPGKGWSGWQKPKNIRNSGGGALRGSVVSPPGRYLQYRILFARGGKSALEGSRLYYMPQNRATRVLSIKIAPAGKKKDKDKLVTIKTGATKPRSPALKLTWTAKNLDKDETVYTLRVRREGEARWRTIASDKPIVKAEFEWNTETFPDGYYRLRVTASDERANPGRQALESHKTTAPFLVDNQRPRVEGLNVRFPAVSARAVDGLSAIAEAAYSVDDGPWHVVGSVDGLFDDQTELLNVTLDRKLSLGLHTLAIRVADEAGNIGSASVTFRR